MRVLTAALLLVSNAVVAEEIPATPGDYKSLLPTLQPGDTLQLAAGTYPRLNISGLNGDSSSPITIEGPQSGAPAVIEADTGPCCNTIEITNSSYVVLRRLTVDGLHVDGAFGLSAKGGTGNLVHHITVEDCTFINHDGSQQTVAISTKTPTWGWVIRNNRILTAGTGMYLGNSTGSDPFIGGLIEGNLVQDTIGYNMQIKWQLPRPTVSGMPQGQSTTLIRHNVFIKNDAPSPDGDRPNVLVGGFPSTGPGSTDRYEIYGNFFFHNPRESLLQVSGRVSVHDNVFVDAANYAVLARDHDLPLQQAYVYNNTVYKAATGISFGSDAPQGDAVTGNLVFATTGISGQISDQRDNLTDTVANAAQYVGSPSATLGSMDFYPKPGQCEGPAVDLSKFSADVDFELDFNGLSKGTRTFRGAYAGSGVNPGWTLAAEVKGYTPTTPATDAGTGGPVDAGGTGGPGDAGGNSGVDASTNGTDGGQQADAGEEPTGVSSGCGCGGGPVGSAALALLSIACLLLARRR